MVLFIPVLENLFSELNSLGVGYLVVRDYNTADAINNATDLDVSINVKDKTKVKKLLTRQGWYSPSHSIVSYSHSQFYKWEGKRIYKLDILWGFFFDDGKYELCSADEYYASFSYLGSARIPNNTNGLTLLYLHVLLDKKEISEKNKLSLSQLLDNCNGEQVKCYDRIKQIIQLGLPQNGDYELLINNLIKSGIIIRLSAFKRSIRKVYRWVIAHLLKKQYKFALIGVDGSGKSSALKSLEKYYGEKVYSQYFGFRDFKTFFAIKMCSDDFSNSNKYLRHFGRILAIYGEMWKRYLDAVFSRKKVLLFDRFVWEAADNSTHKVEKVINSILFKFLFPSVDSVIYLYCPVEVSLMRKNDIEDVNGFKQMKSRFDKLYKTHKHSLAIDTSKTSEQEVLELIAQFVCERTGALVY